MKKNINLNDESVSVSVRTSEKRNDKHKSVKEKSTSGKKIETTSVKLGK